MSDQPGPAPAADTPTPDAPAPADQGATSSVDQPQIPDGYVPEDRYKEAQAWGTKSSQEAAQYRAVVEALQSDDPDIRLQAAQALGLEFVDDTGNDEYQDPYEQLSEKIAALEGQLTQRQQQELESQQIAHIEQFVDSSLDAIEGLPAEARDWITARALSQPGTAEGLPDIQAAYHDFQQLENGLMKRWAESKRTHHISPVGGEGSKALDQIDDRSERQEAMAQKFAELEQFGRQ
jgi:hypothetical protein